MKLSNVNRNKLRTKLATFQYHTIIESALEGIQRVGPDASDWEQPFKIECKIHRMVLTGLYGYKRIEEALGKLFVDETFDPVKQRSAYRARALRKVQNFDVSIFVNPVTSRPACLMRIDPQGDVSIKAYKEFLKWLDSGLPGLKVSSVEYANDQFCNDPKAAENLFMIERRHLYVPRQRHMRTYGETIARWGKKTRMNTVFRIGDNKLYERGPDKKKQDQFWLYRYVDRVRLEHTATREELRKRNIDRLTDFISHPRFYAVNKLIYGFKHFEGSKHLPRPWEGYPTPDDSGEPGCFQAEQIFHRRKVNNIGQYLTDSNDFEPLLERLRDLWLKFDEEWEAI
jgi:hypothetical protein